MQGVEPRLPYLGLPLPQKETPPTRHASYENVEGMFNHVGQIFYETEDQDSSDPMYKSVFEGFRGVLKFMKMMPDLQEVDQGELDKYISVLYKMEELCDKSEENQIQVLSMMLDSKRMDDANFVRNKNKFEDDPDLSRFSKSARYNALMGGTGMPAGLQVFEDQLPNVNYAEARLQFLIPLMMRAHSLLYGHCLHRSHKHCSKP
jgi:hypothetical protein